MRDSGPEDDALSLGTRRRIYEIVRKYAGIHFREVCRRSGMPEGNVKYHLAYLSRHDLVKEERDAGFVRYFPRGSGREDKRILGLLRQKRMRLIILTILGNGRCSHKHLVEDAGLSPSAVSWYLRRLVESGVVEEDGRLYRVKDEEAVVRLLIAYRESFLDSLVDHVIEMWEL